MIIDLADTIAGLSLSRFLSLAALLATSAVLVLGIWRDEI
jgi:hypothetical protein